MADSLMLRTARALRLPRRHSTAGEVLAAVLRNRDPDVPAWRLAAGADVGIADVTRHEVAILRLPRGELERLRLALVGHVHPEDMAALRWLLRPYDRPSTTARPIPAAGDLPGPASWTEALAAFGSLRIRLQERLRSDDPRQVAGALADALRAGTPVAVALAWALDLYDGDAQEARRAMRWAMRATKGGAPRAG